MFAGSIQMIFFSTLTSTIGSQDGPNKMIAVKFLSASLSEQQKLDPVFFFILD